MKEKNLSLLREQRTNARKALMRIGKAAFKPETSAKWVDITRNLGGKVRVQIEHDTIKGVTPQMMKWWFENLSGMTTWNGIDFSGPEIAYYHLWHYRDHIAVTPLTHGKDGRENRGFLEGCESRIEERFNEVHFHVHHRMRTTKLDEEEFTFLIKCFGITCGKITHLYSREENGLRFYAETEMGLEIPVIGWLFNWLFLPLIYNKKTAEHWIKHNIEETGRTQDILPVLYENRNRNLQRR